jgi:hypothetical protein
MPQSLTYWANQVQCNQSFSVVTSQEKTWMPIFKSFQRVEVSVDCSLEEATQLFTRVKQVVSELLPGVPGTVKMEVHFTQGEDSGVA